METSQCLRVLEILQLGEEVTYGPSFNDDDDDDDDDDDGGRRRRGWQTTGRDTVSTWSSMIASELLECTVSKTEVFHQIANPCR